MKTIHAFRRLPVVLAFALSLCPPARGEEEIDHTGWEKILVDPATGKPISSFADFYAGYGVMAVYGPQARILSLYAAKADHQDIDSERMGSKLIAASAYDAYTAMRKGPSIAASTMGDGRVVVVALDPWFARFGNFGSTQKETRKSKGIPIGKDGEPLYELINGTDEVFLNNAVRWLGKDRDPSHLKIATSEKHLAPAWPHGEVTVLEESNFDSALATADVFVGRVQSMSAKQIDALIRFAEEGGGLLTGDSPEQKVDPDKRGGSPIPTTTRRNSLSSTETSIACCAKRALESPMV